MDTERIIEDVRTLTYKGQQITLTWCDDEVGWFGGFYGWRVGDKEELPVYRHSNVCYDNARQYVDEMAAADDWKLHDHTDYGALADYYEGVLAGQRD